MQRRLYSEAVLLIVLLIPCHLAGSSPDIAAMGEHITHRFTEIGSVIDDFSKEITNAGVSIAFSMRGADYAERVQEIREILDQLLQETGTRLTYKRDPATAIMATGRVYFYCDFRIK